MGQRGLLQAETKGKVGFPPFFLKGSRHAKVEDTRKQDLHQEFSMSGSVAEDTAGNSGGLDPQGPCVLH